MRPLFKYSAIAAAIVMASTSAAYADSASSNGGLTVKSDDGRFEATLGGRVHFDGALLNADTANQTANNEASGFYFRRVFISLNGKAYGWMYKIDDDVSSTTTPAAGFNEVWLGKKFGDNTVYLGQAHPWRSLDELASNNELVFMERNALSANGLFGGRDYTQGVYYKYASNGLWLGASGYSQTKAGKGTTEGTGGNARVAYAPINAPGALLHVGVTYSVDQFDLNATNPGFGSPTAGYSTAYSKSGATFNVFSFAATPAVTSAKVNTATAELMGIIGPVFLQGEYGTAKYKDDTPGTNPNNGQTVNAYSATASWFVTGESRVYKADNASYGTPKPKSVDGAVEVAVRYDNVKNKDTGAKVDSITLGANYYVNPNVRFMLDYAICKADKTSGLAAGATEAKPKALMARAQFAF
ncbi:MAG: OprO/OprP family phosphate-selective porin [Stenotrophobium sp.]